MHPTDLQATIAQVKRLLRKLREGSITDEEFGLLLPLVFEAQKRTQALSVSKEELQSMIDAAARAAGH